MNRIEIDRKDAKSPNSRRAVVATLYVLGLASLMWLYTGKTVDLGGGPAVATAPDQPVPVVAGNDYLHAPTSDPSLPSLEASLSRSDTEPADKPQAPTF